MNKEKELGALKQLLSEMPKPELDQDFEDRMLNAVFARLDEDTCGQVREGSKEQRAETALTGSADGESEHEIRQFDEKNFIRELNNRERNAKQTKRLKVIAYSLMVAASLFIGIVYYPNLVQLARNDRADFGVARSHSDGAEQLKGEDFNKEAKSRSIAISDSAAAPESTYDREDVEGSPESAYDSEDMTSAPESKTNALDKGTSLEDAKMDASETFSGKRAVMISLWILHLLRIL